MTMEWRDMSEMLIGLPAPAGCTIDQLARVDLDALTERLRAWYPDIHVGSESRHLERGFYERDFFLRGEERDRPLIGLVVRSADNGDIIGFQALERNVRGLQISSPMGVAEPSQRGLGLGSYGTQSLEQIGRSIGAEIAFYFSTLKIPQTQKAAERNGYRLVGIVPAFDVDALAPGVIGRVYEGLYAKVLTGPERVKLPDWSALIPSTRALYTHLFGRHPDDVS
jgi:hypothetical protein